MGVVVVAAGSGTRLGAERPKAFVEVVGTTILERAVAGVLEAAVDELVVVVPEDLVAEATGRVDPLRPEGVDVTVVAGGAERTDSVAAGLAALSDAVSVVLVHDAARCLTPVVVFERVLAALAAGATEWIHQEAVVAVEDVAADAREILRAAVAGSGGARLAGCGPRRRVG